MNTKQRAVSSEQKTENREQQAISPVVAESATTNNKQQTANGSVPWGPLSAVLFALFIYFAAQVVAMLVLSVLPLLLGWSEHRITDWINNTISAQFGYVLLAETLTFAAVYWYVGFHKSDLRVLGFDRPKLMYGLYTLGGFALYFTVYAVVLGVATQLFPSININQKQELGFDNAANSTIDLLLTFVSLVVLPPIVEETVFRGLIFKGLLTKCKPIVAALGTSLLFATAHLQFGNGQPLLWVAAIDTFTLSMVLCLLRYKTGSLWPGIGLHMLKNCIAFLSLYIFVH